jgi:hypothetical protein
MAKHDIQMTKEIKRRSEAKRRRRRSLQLRIAIVLVALTVLATWIALFMA